MLSSSTALKSHGRHDLSPESADFTMFGCHKKVGLLRLEVRCRTSEMRLERYIWDCTFLFKIVKGKGHTWSHGSRQCTVEGVRRKSVCHSAGRNAQLQIIGDTQIGYDCFPKFGQPART